MLIKYTITITWFLTDSHTKVTSPRTSKKKAAQNLKLPFHTNTPLWRMHLPLSVKFCAARVFWCDLKQILERCSYKKLWKPTASTLSLRHGRTTNRKRTANLGGRPKGHRATCINLDLHDNERRWKWKRSKLLVSGSICFWISRNNRGIGHVSYRIIYLLGLTIPYYLRIKESLRFRSSMWKRCLLHGI